jgi:hydrogenase maturation protease
VSLLDESAPATAGRLLVIGIGNPYRRDDGVGPHLAQAVRQRGPRHAHVLEHSGEGGSLMQVWRKQDAVYIFDAVRSHGVPGAISDIDALRERLPESFYHYSSHAFGLAEAVEMARVLDQLPAVLRIFGVEGADFGSGQGLTAPVSAAVGMLLPRVLRELRHVGLAETEDVYA